ncbi:N-6 DNA methylase [Mycobacteroides abscessus]|uniref:N-6 DNA methylase n=1 Tax=Mycobacteroides abscessus TaxID=36809 RepID=UPI001CDC155C|nr:N-6 DNA methylase [Mycobacteroides abscessus]MCA4749586.1 N-6 DNA methylase [Mycobacteroides abscessus]MCA4767259.1 N-6 DNA methylase [Mycobacteroides abscessus]UBV08846.1 N-6 DNA methylase [Mycobacteroides abscessus]UBV26038.1 N-6 DNA methylase [Mycobacteroides abscessus]
MNGETTDPDALPNDMDAPDGRVIDYISGRNVAAKPEELLAVQPFSRQLVEDYGYPKDHIQTRPQWHVKARPSDRVKTYPVDIAVFTGSHHRDDDLFLVVECKKPHRRDGRDQLEDYLRLSRAHLGVWTNGHERLFLRKRESAGTVTFEEIPNIPRFGQRVEDIGLFKRADLQPTHNLKAVFRSIRNYLAANAVGMTRDEPLAQQIMNLIFCKIYDERFTRRNSVVTFRAGVDEPAKDVATRVKASFKNVVQQYSDVFSSSDKISLDDRSIAYVVGELQQYCLIECERDVVGDAFETFIGPSLKGSQGQFFTPRNVTSLVRALVHPRLTDMILDPACGSGGFLVEALRGLWDHVDTQASELDWPDSERESEKQKVAIRQLRGIDKDEFLSKVAKAYMALLGDGRGGVFCENSLVPMSQWETKTRQEVAVGEFDVIMTNPPFGQKLKVTERNVLDQYDLGQKWKKTRGSSLYDMTDKAADSQTPQILFIERCLDLLKDGGRMGIVLPESMLCNPSHRYIMQYILSRAMIRAVISVHEDLFQPHTHAKTAVVLLQKGPEPEGDSHEVFMAVARWCGHDSRGHAIPFDDLPKIAERWESYQAGEVLEFDHLGFVVSSTDITDMIYLPKYYNPEVQASVDALAGTHELLRLGDLADADVIEVSTGDEVGKLAYGTGAIPFIRTSDIANWQIKGDPKHGLSEALYERYADTQSVEPGDILMVRDGTYLVGTCAIVTELDWRIVYQSHILKFKVRDKTQMDPHLLLALLSSPLVKAQIFAKRFTQDIIDTLGGRWRELVLPVPNDKKTRNEITENVKQAILLRREASELSWQAVQRVAPVGSATELDDDAEYGFGVLNR